MFVQKLNRITGESEWVVAEPSDPEDVDVDATQGDQMALRVAVSSYLDMLHDTRRNAAYHLALEKAVKPGSTVLDIGTGTGLLAMLAARVNGGCAGHVVACETFPPMARLAQQNIRHNGLEDRVTVVRKRSDDMEVGASGGLLKAADVLVTEIFDSELLGEGVLPTLRDAVGRLLQPDAAQVVPASAVIYAQMNGPSMSLYPSFWHNILNLKFSWGFCLRLCMRALAQLVESPTLAHYSPDSVAANMAAVLGRRAHSPAQHSSHDAGAAFEAHVDQLVDLRPLSAPFEVFSFQLALPPPHGRTVVREIAACAAGRAHALVTWWDLHLDPEKTIVLSTAPSYLRGSNSGGSKLGEASSGYKDDVLPAQEWRDHWKQCVWVFGADHAVRVEASSTVQVECQHDDVSVTYRLQHSLPSNDGHPSQSDTPLVLPRELVWALYRPSTSLRSAQLRDMTSMQAYADAVREILKVTRFNGGIECETEPEIPVRVLSVGDDAFVPLLAISLGMQVTAIQPSLPLKKLLQAAATGEEDGKVPGLLGKFRALDCGMHQLPRFPVPADAVLAQPHYRDGAGQLPWTHLRFWYDVAAARESGAVKSDANVLPARAILRGVGARLPEFARTRRPLPVSLEGGIDLAPANGLLGASCQQINAEDSRLTTTASNPVLPFPVSQCGTGYQETTARFDLLRFDFTAPVQETVASVRTAIKHANPVQVATPSSPAANIDVLVLWLDWELDVGGHYVVSGAPNSDGAPTLAGSIQGVQVVPCQTSSSNKFDSFLEVHARFDHTECDVIVGSSVMRE